MSLFLHERKVITVERRAFTKEMKKEHTILIPSMLPIHFNLLKNILKNCGYNVVLLENTSQAVVEAGLKYVQNDTCYPALLVIGQMIDALSSGKYDLEKTSLMITQTGGGCRASNYIHLLRKALNRAGYGNIPVISLNPAGMEKNPGFKLGLPLMRKMLGAVIYGDCLMLLRNQIKPYELVAGETEKAVDKWTEILSDMFVKGKGLSVGSVRKNTAVICQDFAKIQRRPIKKPKVGIVGEIYVKYAALANNNLEDFLVDEEGCEINVPGLMGFVLYCADNYVQGSLLYGEGKIVAVAVKVLIGYIRKLENAVIASVSEAGFEPPAEFYESKAGVSGIIGYGAKMGEGWLLTAEMVELIEHGVNNIICTQPFGCLPNHICGKGMMKKLKDLYPDSNIVPIDYDPSATRVNQENRIKLMLAVAREGLNEPEKNHRSHEEKVLETVK